MESISTYCDTTSPVILVGTHKDVINEQTEKDKDHFSSFLSQLPDVSQLQQHLHRKNYFELGKPEESRDEIARLEKCIVEMVKKQSTWGEIVPKLWKEFDQKLHRLKSKRLITYSDLIKSIESQFPSGKDVLDMLRFFHDCGKILFFNEKGLNEIIILDVQWFVDAFKNILTDRNHQTNVLRNQWEAFSETGMLEEEHLEKIWEELGLQEMKTYQTQVLLYMQRLGLIAIGESGKLYVPSMNSLELTKNDFSRIEQANHTNILRFRFPEFLPHFYFYRLVVASLEEWDAQIEKNVPLLFKNAVFLKYKDRYHKIVLGVSNTQIHLQIYTCNSKLLKKDVTLTIRNKIESFLEQLTQTFHKPVEYFSGFTCKPTNVTEEHEDSVFILESVCMNLYFADPYESLLPCPAHERNFHNLDLNTMIMYWRKTSELHDTCCQRLLCCRKLNQASTQYRFPVNEVDSCPTTNHTWYEAGARLNCSHDVYNRLQYLCIPNQEKTTLLEFCYDKIIGLYEK
ncbi:cyclic GMP-binding protein C-like, partial [Saccostrea cucullata]|uniref:cyclic GMP-binding protein C-like n=1 Tax=Saccostrea cuccullata TaxID=36930 RepID=UPI002ED1147E